jgi:hypothetical protein
VIEVELDSFYRLAVSLHIHQFLEAIVLRVFSVFRLWKSLEIVSKDLDSAWLRLVSNASKQYFSWSATNNLTIRSPFGVSISQLASHWFVVVSNQLARRLYLLDKSVVACCVNYRLRLTFGLKYCNWVESHVFLRVSPYRKTLSQVAVALALLLWGFIWVKFPKVNIGIPSTRHEASIVF